MKHSLASSLGSLALVASCVGLATSEPMDAARPLTDSEFARVMQRSNAAEIASARYVLRYSKDPAVRTFATQMIADHSTAAVQLQSAARLAHVRLTERVPAGRMLSAYEGASEPALDQAYMRQQVRAHEAALKLVDSESTGGTSAELKSFAGSQAGVIQQHLAKAQYYLAAGPMASSAPGGQGVMTNVQGSSSAAQMSPVPVPSGTGSPAPMPSTGIPSASPAASTSPRA